MCVSPSELQRIHGIWSGQHLIPDWSHRKPGREGCSGTVRSLTFASSSRFAANCDWVGTYPPQRAVITALKSDESLDCGRLAVIGGSHGGFLSCHLVGQFPEVYRACAVRNPVVNAATLLGTSDIVDW